MSVIEGYHFTDAQADTDAAVPPIIMEERSAPLLDNADRQVDYAVFRHTDDDLETALQPMLYIAGFMDVARTYDNKIALAQHLARHSLGMMVVKNDRSLPMQRDPRTGKPDAMLTLANNSLSVIQAEGLQHTALPTAAHSEGGMVAVRAIQKADQLGWSSFTKANVALLAPAGVSKEETPGRLFNRFGRSLASEMLHEHTDGIDPAVVAALAITTAEGFQAFKANPVRAGREFRELGERKIHLLELCHRVGSLALVPYGEDRLKPDRIYESAVRELLARDDAPHNFSYRMPYSTQPDRDGKPLGVRNAHHLDCIGQPGRVADSIGPFLNGSEMLG